MRSRCSTLLILLHLLTLLFLLLLLRGIRPKDLVDLVDLLLVDDTVTQELRMQSACASLGNGRECTYSLANLHQAQDATADALQLSHEHGVIAGGVGGADATLATSNTIAFGLAAVVVEGFEPSNKLVSEVAGASLALVNLLLVVGGTHGSRIGGASSLDLLEQLKERLLHRHTVVLAIPAPGALLAQGSDDNVTLVLFARG
jgi:hypothetical protein